jgi:type IV pilus assembly protein PilM
MLMGLFGRKSIVGVDIDSYEIRVVELGGIPGAAKLVNAGRKLLPEGAVKDGRICDAAAVGNTLEKLWSEQGLKSRDVILGVSNQDVLVRFATFPEVAMDKLDNIVRFQAQDYLPIPVEEAIIDYMVTGDERLQGDRLQDDPLQEDNKIKVLLVAARKNMINDFLSSFEIANISVRDIDFSTLAIARVVPVSALSGTCVIVNIGHEQTNLLLLNASAPQLARTLMTDQVFRADTDRGKLIDMLAGEIRTSIGYFQTQSRDSTVQKLFICGCGSRLKGIRESLAETLDISIDIINPFSNVNKSGLKNKYSDIDSTDFSVGMSLALRGLKG